MKDKKLNRLFEAARSQPAPAPSENFADDVLHAVRREPSPNRDSLLEQLTALFPRLAFAAVLAIGLFIGSDFLMTAFNLPSLSDGVAQLSDQWLLIGNGI